MAKQTDGMNIKTLRKIIVTFNQVMNYSVRHRYIDFNPVRDAERPKDQGNCEDYVIRILMPEEIAALLDAFEDKKYQTLIRFSIFSGARQGEVFGLKWSDLDWINNQVNIQRTYNNGRWYRPKSKSSIRRIDLGPQMMAELKKWKIACPPNQFGLVFPGDTGGPIGDSSFLKKYFHPSLKKAGIEKIRFHWLRHTYASFLIEQGENIKYIQSQLGHSTPSVTLNIYAHLMRPVNQESALRLESTILNSGHNLVTKEVLKEKKG